MITKQMLLEEQLKIRYIELMEDFIITNYMMYTKNLLFKKND